MSETTPDGQADLAGFPYHELLNVARSAGLDLSDQPKKDELTARMIDAGVEYEAGTWLHEGEEVKREPVQTNSGSTGPSDTTVFYCLPRESTEDHVEEVRDALSGAGFELREAGTDGEKYKIVVPAEENKESADTDDSDDVDLDEMTRDELYEMAQEQDIDGRSEMSKTELMDALAA